MHFGEKIIITGEGDESVRASSLSIRALHPALRLTPTRSQPDSSAPGDLHITVRPLPHPTFTLCPPTRPDRPADLSTTLSLTLSESLLGFSRLILVHLDGRGLRVTQPAPGERGWRVLKTGDEVVVPGEGMWRHGARGDLLVRVEVAMPDEQWAMGLADKGGVETLRGLLPPRRPDLGRVVVEEGKETDEVELEEKRDRPEDEEQWVRRRHPLPPLSPASLSPRASSHLLLPPPISLDADSGASLRAVSRQRAAVRRGRGRRSRVSAAVTARARGRQASYRSRCDCILPRIALVYL